MVLATSKSSISCVARPISVLATGRREAAGRFLLQRSRQRLHPRLGGGDGFLALDEVPGALDDYLGGS